MEKSLFYTYYTIHGNKLRLFVSTFPQPRFQESDRFMTAILKSSIINRKSSMRQPDYSV